MVYVASNADGKVTWAVHAQPRAGLEGCEAAFAEKNARTCFVLQGHEIYNWKTMGRPIPCMHAQRIHTQWHTAFLPLRKRKPKKVLHGIMFDENSSQA